MTIKFDVGALERERRPVYRIRTEQDDDDKKTVGVGGKKRLLPTRSQIGNCCDLAVVVVVVISWLPLNVNANVEATTNANANVNVLFVHRSDEIRSTCMEKTNLRLSGQFVSLQVCNFAQN